MSQGTFQGTNRGLMAVRHHDSSREPHERVILFGGLVELIDERNQATVREEGRDWRNKADFQSYVRWRSVAKEKRRVSAASPAFSSITGAPAGGGTQVRGGGAGKLLPLHDIGKADDRFEGIAPRLGNTPPGFGGFPSGTTGIVSAAMVESRQVEVFHPDWTNSLIAVNYDGRPSLGTRVYDLTGSNALHPTRHTELQSAWTVLDLDPGGPLGLKGTALALNVGKGGRIDGGPGYGLLVNHDRGEYMALPSSHGGPLIGGPGCQHAGQLGRDADGRLGVPAHLDAGVYLLGPAGDGPMLVEQVPWAEPEGEGDGWWAQVHMRFIPRGDHSLGPTKGVGFYGWEVRMPSRILPPPWVDPPPPPPEDPPPIPPPPIPPPPIPFPPLPPPVSPPPPPPGGGGGGGQPLPPAGGFPPLPSGGITVAGGTDGLPVPTPDPSVDYPDPPPEPGEQGGEPTGDGSTPEGGELGSDPSDIFGPDQLDPDAISDELTGGGSAGDIFGEDQLDPDAISDELADLGFGAHEAEPGTVDDETDGATTPLYEYHSQCTFAPQVGLIGMPTAGGAIGLGGVSPEFFQEALQDLPLVGTTTGISAGSGLLGGADGVQIQSGVYEASGAGIMHPVGATLGALVSGYYDPTRGGNAYPRTYDLILPGGLSSIYFAHPSQDGGTGLVSSGARITQASDGDGCSIQLMDADGDVDASVALNLSSGGVDVIGTLKNNGITVSTGGGSGFYGVGGSGEDGAVSETGDVSYGATKNATSWDDGGNTVYPGLNKPLVVLATGNITHDGAFGTQGRGYVEPS